MFLQALQEDEDENIEEGARIAIKMLGPEKQHLYPRIFQLVMADTAFTEGNKNNNNNDSDDASSSSLVDVLVLLQTCSLAAIMKPTVFSRL